MASDGRREQRWKRIFREFLLCSYGWMWIMWMLKKKRWRVGIEIKERLTV